MGPKYLIAVQCTIIRQQNLLMLTLQVKKLKLVVDDAGNGNGNDHADWADAWLSFK